MKLDYKYIIGIVLLALAAICSWTIFLIIPAIFIYGIGLVLVTLSNVTKLSKIMTIVIGTLVQFVLYFMVVIGIGLLSR